MRETRRKVKGRYSKKLELQNYINSLKCYLMKIFSMAVRMRGARRRVKGRYSRKGERCVSVQYFLAKPCIGEA